MAPYWIPPEPYYLRKCRKTEDWKRGNKDVNPHSNVGLWTGNNALVTQQRCMCQEGGDGVLSQSGDSCMLRSSGELNIVAWFPLSSSLICFIHRTKGSFGPVRYLPGLACTPPKQVCISTNSFQSRLYMGYVQMNVRTLLSHKCPLSCDLCC